MQLNGKIKNRFCCIGGGKGVIRSMLCEPDYTSGKLKPQAFVFIMKLLKIEKINSNF